MTDKIPTLIVSPQLDEYDHNVNISLYWDGVIFNYERLIDFQRKKRVEIYTRKCNNLLRKIWRFTADVKCPQFWLE
jgi:hypothetical protein